MGYRKAWGGAAMPIMVVTDPETGIATTWNFSDEDNIRLKIDVLPVKERIIGLESGRFRHRQRGFQLRFTLTLENIDNAELVDFISKFYNARLAEFYPHPGEMGHADNLTQDYWQVIPGNSFEPDYFNERWIGHSLTVIMLSNEVEREMPENTTGGIFAASINPPA